MEKKVFSKENENDIPIYNQILENEYIKLYELDKQVKMLCDDPSLRVASCRTDELTYISQLSDESKVSCLLSEEIGGFKKVFCVFSFLLVSSVFYLSSRCNNFVITFIHTLRAIFETDVLMC